MSLSFWSAARIFANTLLITIAASSLGCGRSKEGDAAATGSNGASQHNDRDASPTGSGAAVERHGIAPTTHPPSILVVTAVDYEFSAASATLTNRMDSMLDGRQVAEGTINDHRVVVIRAGWGKAQAAGATAAAMDAFPSDIVLMAGIGGGLDANSVTSGDVVVVDGAFQYDLGKMSKDNIEIWPPETPLEKPYASDDFISDRSLLPIAWQSAREAKFTQWTLPAHCGCEHDGTHKPTCTGPEEIVGRPEPKVCVGTVGTGDAFVVDPSLSEKLSATRNVVSVDMETAAVAQEAANHGKPFLAVRVVGDVVNGDNEDLYYCLKPMSGPRLEAVLRVLLPALVASRNSTPTPEPVRCRTTLVASGNLSLIKEPKGSSKVHTSRVHAVRVR